MPTFTKQILRPGRYLARTPDGARKEVEFSPDRLTAIADTFAQMQTAGLRVPAPWRHDLGAIPVNGAAGDSLSYRNAGFWKRTWLDDKSGILYGELEAPDNEDTAKIGTTVTEVSPFILPEWLDGVGNTWRDAMMHVALVTHPIQPGQDNYVKSPDGDAATASQRPAEGAFAVALSHLLEGIVMADDAPAQTAPAQSTSTDTQAPPTVADAIAALQEVGLVLSKDTTEENLVERIVTAARAIAGKKAADAADADPGQSGQQTAKQQPIPIAMGEDDQMNAEELQQQLEVAKTRTDQALAFAAEQAREGYAVRVRQLIETGRTTPKFVKERLRPMIQGLQFALDDEGKPAPNELDTVLEALEAQPARDTFKVQTEPDPKAKGKAKGGTVMAQLEDFPDDWEGDQMTDAQAGSVVLELSKSAGQQQGKK